LINAAKIVRGRIGEENKFDILIAGKGDFSYFEGLLTKEDYSYIHMLKKYITNSEIPDIFRKAMFVVLPYTTAFQHSASGVIPLAYTFSKPVIVSNIGSLVEYVDHGKTGFIFEAGNSAQLAEYIVELLENNSRCIEMGKNAYEKMLKEMSLERCCEILNSLYNSL
jgi:glycosyltransferase involved in cell wall biosynthesis